MPTSVAMKTMICAISMSTELSITPIGGIKIEVTLRAIAQISATIAKPLRIATRG